MFRCLDMLLDFSVEGLRFLAQCECGFTRTYRWREGAVLVHTLHFGIGHPGDGRVLKEMKSRWV